MGVKLFKRSNVKVQNRKRRIKFLVRGVWGFVILAGLCAGGRYFSQHLESLKIKSIVVEGVRAPLTSERVIQRTGLQVGMPIFSVPLQEIVRHLKEDPWIDHVKVTRSLPHKMIIQVTPYDPKLILSVGKFYYIGPKGEIFKELTDKADKKDFPYFTGLTREEIEQDPSQAREIIGQALKLLESYESQQLIQRLGVSEIHYDRASGFSIFPEKERMKIIFGFDDFETKVKRLVTAMEKLKGSGRSLASMDLNYEGKVILTM
jgi:cell division septal protein FtsQ